MTLSLICPQCQAAVDVEVTRIGSDWSLWPSYCPQCGDSIELPPIGEWERQWEAEHGGPGWGEGEDLL